MFWLLPANLVIPLCFLSQSFLVTRAACEPPRWCFSQTCHYLLFATSTTRTEPLESLWLAKLRAHWGLCAVHLSPLPDLNSTVHLPCRVCLNLERILVLDVLPVPGFHSGEVAGHRDLSLHWLVELPQPCWTRASDSKSSRDGEHIPGCSLCPSLLLLLPAPALGCHSLPRKVWVHKICSVVDEKKKIK